MLISYSELAREKMWARIHLIPALQAEEDRDQVRRYLADKAREKELLGTETKVYHSDRYAERSHAPPALVNHAITDLFDLPLRSLPNTRPSRDHNIIVHIKLKSMVSGESDIQQAGKCALLLKDSMFPQGCRCQQDIISIAEIQLLKIYYPGSAVASTVTLTVG
jgi:hypothetical protein